MISDLNDAHFVCFVESKPFLRVECSSCFLLAKWAFSFDPLNSHLHLCHHCNHDDRGLLPPARFAVWLFEQYRPVEERGGSRQWRVPGALCHPGHSYRWTVALLCAQTYGHTKVRLTLGRSSSLEISTTRSWIIFKVFFYSRYLTCYSRKFIFFKTLFYLGVPVVSMRWSPLFYLHGGALMFCMLCLHVGALTAFGSNTVSRSVQFCFWCMSFCFSDGPICRICHEGSSSECLLSPCDCTGTLGTVHKSCLEKWLSSSNTSYCELCHTEFSIERRPRPLTEVTKVNALRLVCINLFLMWLSCDLWFFLTSHLSACLRTCLLL